MTTVTADKVVVELSVLLDKYQADVRSARSNFEQAMSATQISAANAERSINTAANKIAASTVGIGNEAKRTAAIVEQANAAMGESATATAAVIARATELQTAEFAKQAAASQKAAASIQETSATIKSGLLAGAAPIASLFAGAEVVKLTDEYIKFTNSLRATGLEGAALTGVQERLFAVAQKYGAPLESLGALYSRAAIAGKELGLSQDQLIKLSEGVAASFKVAGTGAAQQKGALTQLSEAIGEPIVRARQFNSLLNDAPPIIQAVARGLDAAGGSVGKLGALIRAGGVTNTAFFAAFLKGSQSTIAQADKFQLTFSAAFTVLGNALSKYIGETNEGLGASNRFALGIQGIANNLDTIIPALGVIAVAYGTMKVASAVAGSAAVQAARDVAAATTAETTAIVDGRTAAAIAAKGEADAARESVALNQLSIAKLREKIVTMEAASVATAELAAETSLLANFERSLAIAEGEAAVAIEAETVAVTEAGVAARLAAAGSALFSGALALLGGPIIAPIVLVVGALTAAILYYRNESAAAEKQTKDFADNLQRGNDKLDKAHDAALFAAGAILKVGGDAKDSTAHVGAFAGAVGNLADQLHRVAVENRNKDLTEKTGDVTKTFGIVKTLEAKKEQAAIEGAYAKSVGRPSSATQFTADDAKQLADQRALLRRQQGTLDQAVAKPLAGYVNPGDRPNEKNAAAELTELEVQHTAAVKAGNKTAAAQLEEQINIRKLTIKYLKDRLQPEAALAAATADAARIKSGERTGDAAKADKKGVRDNAAEQRKSDAAEAKRLANAKGYTDELDKLDKEYLAAQRSKALSAQEEAARERAIVAADLKRQTDDATAKTKGKDASLTPSQAREEISRATRNAAARNAVIDGDLAEKQAQAAFAVADQQLKIKQDALRLDASLALTAKDRRTAELKILDLQLQEIRLRTAAILASSQTTDAQKAEARAALTAAENSQGNKREQVRRSTQGPGEAYSDSINKTRGQIDEAIQGVAANGMKALDDGLVNAITHFKSLGDVAKNVLDTIVSGLVRVGIEKAIIGPLSNALFGGGSSAGGSGGGLGGLLSGALGSIFHAGRASGGDVSAGTAYMVGENGPEVFKPGTSGKIEPNNGKAANRGGGGGQASTTVHLSQSIHFDVGLESVDQRIGQAAPVILGAAQKGTFDALKNAGIGRI